MHIVVLGGGRAGATLARDLGDRAETTLLDSDPSVVERARRAGVTAHEADVTSAQSLDERGVESADIAVVATDNDAANLLAAQHLRVRFGVDRVVVRVNDPGNVDGFAERGFHPVCATSALADGLGGTVEESRSDAERPA